MTLLHDARWIGFPSLAGTTLTFWRQIARLPALCELAQERTTDSTSTCKPIKTPSTRKPTEAAKEREDKTIEVTVATAKLLIKKNRTA